VVSSRRAASSSAVGAGSRRSSRCGARWRLRTVTVVAAVVLVSAAASLGAAVKPPPGAASLVPSTGIGTPAAMKEARCNTRPEFGVYGNWNTTTIGGGGSGPVCVKPWSDDDHNGARPPEALRATRSP
jgi:hypothetical protein